MIGYIKRILQNLYDKGENVEIVKSSLDSIIKPSDKILDIGPGTGILIRHLMISSKSKNLHAKMHVMDYLQSVLDTFPVEVGKHLFNLHELADTEHGLKKIPIEDATFDLIIFTEVIEHITFPQIMLSEIARMCKPNGYLVITTPNIFCLGNRLATLFGTDKLFRKVGEEGFVSTIEFHRYGHVAHYSPKSLEQLLSPWFTIKHRTGSCFKIPVLRFFQRSLAKLFPNLANHIVIIAKKKDIESSGLKIVGCKLTGATELALPDNRCLHPVPHNKICYDCPCFHKDFLHRFDRRKKSNYIPR